MDKTMHRDIMEGKRKRKRRARRIRRLLFLILLVAFLTQTDMGNSILDRASEIEVDQVREFFAKSMDLVLSLVPNIREWVANGLSHLANHM